MKNVKSFLRYTNIFTSWNENDRMNIRPMAKTFGNMLAAIATRCAFQQSIHI